MSKSSARPVEFVHLLTTARCRNACRFCLNQGHLPGASQELDTGDWLAILSQVAALPTLRHVFFVEREPLERPDILTLLDAFADSSARITLSTGGSPRLDAVLARGLAARIDELIVSFHGDVGVLSRATLERQQTLLELVRTQLLGRVDAVDINTTITLRHRGRINEIVDEVGRRLGLTPVRHENNGSIRIDYVERGASQTRTRVRHNFVRPCLSGGMLTHQAELYWQPGQERELFGEEAVLLRWDRGCYLQSEDRLDVFANSPNGRPCGLDAASQGAVGINRLSIRWDGKVVPCAAFAGFEQGDATQESLMGIWRRAFALWRDPSVVNARTLHRAFPEGHCVYHGDAAFSGDHTEEQILARCRS